MYGPAWESSRAQDLVFGDRWQYSSSCTNCREGVHMSSFLDDFVEAFEAFDRKDPSKMDALLAEDVVMVNPQGTLHGREATMALFRANLDAFVDIVHEVDHESGVIDAGDALVVEFLVRGRHGGGRLRVEGAHPTDDADAPREIAPTGAPFEIRTTDHVWARNGKIVRFHIHNDPSERVSYRSAETESVSSLG